MNAYRVFLIFSGARALLFSLCFSVMMFFWADKVGLNPFQLVLTGTALELSIFLFEIPTGVVADVYSRRLSVIIGTFIIGLGLLISVVPNFAVILFSQALWGFGYTFTSGALNAWITDEIGEENVGATFLRAAQIDRMLGLTSILISFVLAQIAIFLPMLISGSGFLLLGIFLIIYMPEHGFTPRPPEERSSWASMRNTLRDGLSVVKVHPVLIYLLVCTIIMGAFSEGYDRLWLAHLLKTFTLPAIGGLDKVAWMTIINIVGALLGLTVTEFIRRRVNTNDHTQLAQVLSVVIGVLMLSVIGFVMAGHLLLALVMIWTIGLMRDVYGPLYDTWINHGIDSKVRATVLSMAGQTDAAGQILGGPAIGLVANHFSMQIAMTLSSLMLAPMILVFRLTLRRRGKLITELEPA